MHNDLDKIFFMEHYADVVLKLKHVSIKYLVVLE